MPLIPQGPPQPLDAERQSEAVRLDALNQEAELGMCDSLEVALRFFQDFDRIVSNQSIFDAANRNG